MSSHAAQSEFLERRRRELRMSRPLLAQRSGVSLPTVNRILTGGIDRASVANVAAVAGALGVELRLTPIADTHEYRLREAEAKARTLIALLQGSAALEGQAVDAASVEQMVHQTLHELMAGSGKRVWTPL